jgi:signal transduction histidine kinase
LNESNSSRLRLSKTGENLSADDHPAPPCISFSEPTAGKLCAALLAGSLEQTQSLLTAALREDPSFLPWARAAAQQAGRPESLAEDALAAWLAERLPEVLQSVGAGSEGFSELLPVLARKMARLKTLEADFTAAVQREKLSAMAEFAAGAGHEINNPLTVIAGRAQLLLREETDPERRHALALMNTQAMRVYEMIADMMLFARPPQPHPTRVDVAQLLDEVVREMQPAAERQETMLQISGGQDSGFRIQDSERSGQGLEADIHHSSFSIQHSSAAPHPGPLPKGEGTIEITADPVQLTVALKAMVQNSLEALGSGGHVELEWRASTTEVEILIRDDGPGIPAEVRPHIFDPFYSARQAGRGLGLGLCKAWRIVTNHGGRITLEGHPGPGATFRITLPR